MILTEFIFNVLAISGFCLGFRMVTDYVKGDPRYMQMALYWIRKPIDDYREEVEETEQRHNNQARDEKEQAYLDLSQKGEKTDFHSIRIEGDYAEALHKNRQRRIKKLNWTFWLKPVITCVTCMASFWGTLIFWSINWGAWHYASWQQLITMWVLCCFTSAFINAYVWTKWENL